MFCLCINVKVDANGDTDPGVLMSAQTITSENNSTTTTTQITKVSEVNQGKWRTNRHLMNLNRETHSFPCASALFFVVWYFSSRHFSCFTDLVGLSVFVLFYIVLEAQGQKNFFIFFSRKEQLMFLIFPAKISLR